MKQFGAKDAMPASEIKDPSLGIESDLVCHEPVDGVPGLQLIEPCIIAVAKMMGDESMKNHRDETLDRIQSR